MSSDSTARNVTQPLSALCGHEDSLNVPAVERKKTQDAWSLSLAERRASRRLALRLSTQLFFQGHTWKGVTRSLSLGGLSMDFVSDIPAMLNQRMMLSFSPDERGLDSVGIVCGIRSSEDVHVPGRTQAAVTLAIQFIHLSDADERVVASLLSHGATAPRHMRLAAALVVQEGEESLIDTGSLQTAATPPASMQLVRGPERPREERRRQQRVVVGLSTEVSLRTRGGDRPLSAGLTTDLSPNGACVHLSAEEDLLGSELELRWLPSAPLQGSSTDSLSATLCSVVGEVVWTRPVAPEARPGCVPVAGRTVLAGVRFLPVAKEAEDIIEHFLGQVSMPSPETKVGSPTVLSEFSECFRPSGLRIVICHDRPQVAPAADAPIIVLAPGYGESKRDYVPLAYYLAGNGFHVVRYDNVNHVGESDGLVTQFRLEDMEADLETVLDHVANQWPGRPIGLVATSLAGRVALKVAGKVSHVRLLTLINGIMDVRHTLQAVHQEDLIGEHLSGVHKGVVNIMGLTIDADRWLAHAVEGEYADLLTTQRDASRLQTPVVLFHAEQDAWVDPASIERVTEAIGPYLRHSFVVPGALHRLQESPRKARTVYRQIAVCCQQELWPARRPERMVEPSHREIGVQNRLERERSKKRKPMGKSDHVAFWQEYLQNFQTIPNVADFWRLMDHLYRLMGDCHKGERILDAGCGNGNFGVFLQLNQAFRQRYGKRGDFRSPDYVGLDFVPAALAQAMSNFEQVGATLQGQFYEGLRAYEPMSMRVCQADLESALPFPDHSFDRVVCNLVLGYVRDPLFTLREYLRVLTPQGRLVISNLKPYADLSAIYRNFVDTAQTKDQVEEGRRLLDNSGRIKEREGEGTFHFHYQTELESLLRAAGVSRPRVYSTFGNQALIAVAEKGMAHVTVAA
ncbi:MAG TPA: alpha/beta hydrolase [Nitrospira sp.]|nr:alpha/beta hydrolase [Nitrospira sp.]HMX90781.1 alpha/beta hydrolase [Nitrospira sp.]HNA84382.1 alpha/beta hydrolase [Nitrospira sp.]HNG00611.1 alpha/beta hydrolase [Nitrospira sp.]